MTKANEHDELARKMHEESSKKFKEVNAKYLDLSQKQKAIEEKPFRTKPQTVKRDHSVHQGAAEQPDVNQQMMEDREIVPDPEPGQYRNGHKGQITKAIAQRRRARSMSKASRRVNRRRAA